MKSIEKQRELLELQYVLEGLIEQYNEADCESSRYLVKLRFIDYIIDSIEEPKKVLNYMELQEEKFRPFISCLKDVKLSRRKAESSLPEPEPDDDSFRVCTPFMIIRTNIPRGQ